MKKIIILSLLLILGASSDMLAQQTAEQDSVIFSRTCSFESSIDVLGFEKRLKDKNELYIVRNNLLQTITLIKLRVYYKTTEGDMLDYRDVTLEGELLPATTKHFEVPRFDQGKRYYYHQSTGDNPKLEGYPFKITYDLLRYDIAVTK